MKNFQLSSKHLILAVILLVSVGSFGFRTLNTPTQITICHKPPGNVDNCHEITVSINALQAHLDHGDDLVCHNQDELETYHLILQQQIQRETTSLTTNLVVAY